MSDLGLNLQKRSNYNFDQLIFVPTSRRGINQSVTREILINKIIQFGDDLGALIDFINQMHTLISPLFTSGGMIIPAFKVISTPYSLIDPHSVLANQFPHLRYFTDYIASIRKERSLNLYDVKHKDKAKVTVFLPLTDTIVDFNNGKAEATASLTQFINLSQNERDGNPKYYISSALLADVFLGEALSSHGLT